MNGSSTIGKVFIHTIQWCNLFFTSWYFYFFVTYLINHKYKFYSIVVGTGDQILFFIKNRLAIYHFKGLFIPYSKLQTELKNSNK